MSPEQAFGTDVDFKTDLWAMGAIAFQCLCGRPPFSAASFAELVLMICEWPLPVPSAIAPVPRGFDAWFAKAVARDREARFASAKDLIEELRAVLVPGDEVLDVTAPPQTVVAPEPPPPRRSRAPFLIGAVLLLLAAAVFAFSRMPRLSVARTAGIGVHSTHLAVLPFAADEEYLGDGAMEELIAELSRVPRLRVLARSSTVRYRGSKKTPAEIGRELGVERVITGSIRVEKDKVRAVVEVVELPHRDDQLVAHLYAAGQ